MIYNFNETAELLGWYEVVYEDGFIETVPIRYGVNILDWRCQQRLRIEKNENENDFQDYAYNATGVLCSGENSDPVVFSAFEWENGRYGKQIKEINLKAVNSGKNKENAIILMGISVSETTKGIESKGNE
jgi:hypothetical protein